LETHALHGIALHAYVCLGNCAIAGLLQIP
jgi:hypothetical protein